MPLLVVKGQSFGLQSPRVPRGDRRLLSFLVAIGCLCMGCGKTDDLNSPTSIRLRSLAYVYLDYVAATGTSPGNAKQLQAHLKNLPPFYWETLESDDGTDPNFHSDRDGMPFVIRFGIAITDLSKTSKIPIAFEKLGENGMRLVVDLNGVVECLDEAACLERGVTE